MRKLILLLALALPCLAASATVSNAHFNAAGTGANTAETVLTPSNVTAGKFGKLGTFVCSSGYIFAQPLLIPGVSIDGTTYDLLIVTAMDNKICAFNANAPGTAALWTADFGAQFTSYPDYGGGSPFLHGQGIGCLSTPAVDVAAGVLIPSCMDSSGNHILRRLSLTTGEVLTSATITGTYPGTGDPTGGDTVSGGNVVFYPSKQLQRPPLKIANGRVYISFGGIGDNHPDHGWVIAYNATTLAYVTAFCASPNSGFGAIWMSGHGPAIDSSGNLYVTTGNGTYDGITEFGNSVIKLNPDLEFEDWFTPSNQAAIDAVDADVSSAGPILIPGENKLLIAAKDFNVYILDTNCMGHLQGSSVCDLETFNTGGGATITAFSGAFGGMYMNDAAYIPRVNGKLSRYARSAGAFNTTPVQTSGTYGMPGASQIAGSANDTASGIIWLASASASSFTTVRAGTLTALDAADLSLLWSSDANGGDALGNLSKFSSPVPANGRVYVATQSGYVAAYGLLPAVRMQGQVTIGGQVTIH